MRNDEMIHLSLFSSGRTGTATSSNPKTHFFLCKIFLVETRKSCSDTLFISLLPFERVASLAIRSLGLDRPHVAACEQCETSKAMVCRAFGVIGSPSHTPARAANAKPVKPVRCLPCRSLNESTMPLSCSGTLLDAMPFRRMPKEAVQP